MQAAAPLESTPRQHQEWSAKERILVSSVLQLTASFSPKGEHTDDENAGCRSRRKVPFHGIHREQDKTHLAMRTRPSLGSFAGDRRAGNLVSGLRSQPAPVVSRVAGHCGKQGWKLSLTGVRKRENASFLVLRGRASLGRDARKSETRFLVRKVRKYAQEK
jgi:hypothetical protein